MFQVLLQQFSIVSIAALLCILTIAAVMSGLSGFGFSAIGALSLCVLPPALGIPLLMTLSSANQLMALRQLKADLRPLREWWPSGPAPYLMGGALGVPIGLAILGSLPTVTLMATLGCFLVAYAAYSIMKPNGLHIVGGNHWLAAVLVGLSGGVIGGFSAFPGAAVVTWSGLRRLPKQESRSVVQPYILGLQLISLGTLAIQRPQTFGAVYWALLVISVPVVLPGTLFGVSLYRSLSDVNFRRVTFTLLAVSGAGLVIKAVAAHAIAK